jgi:hypothetical protein
MSNTFRSLCAELIDKIDYTWNDIPEDVRDLILRARAELAQTEPVAPPMPVPGDAEVFWNRYDQPEPVAPTPTDEELISPIMWMIDECVYDNDKGEIAQNLRELIARWGTPANNTSQAH